MTNYSNDPATVRVDFFKPSGKWYETIEMQWFGYTHWDIHEAFQKSLREAVGNRYQGLTAVCLEPYHENAHPLMIVNW